MDELISPPGVQANGSRKAKIRAQILSCARECFARDGFERPTMDDIASAAGVARQTVYNHFVSKREIIDQVTLLELAAVADRIRSQVRSYSRHAEKIVEVVVLSVILAHENPYIRRLNYDLEASPQAHPNSPVHGWFAARWRRTLEAAREAGELRSDLDIERVISWLGFCQWVLQIKMDQSGIDEREVRLMVQTFMVPPLLNDAGEGRDGNFDNVYRELALYRDIVSEQALRIKKLELALAESAREPG